MTRTRRDFSVSLACELGITAKDAAHIVDHFVDQMHEWLTNEDAIKFRGFGTLKVVERAPKIGTNPKCPEEGLYLIPSRKVVKFTVGTYLHEALNPEKT